MEYFKNVSDEQIKLIAKFISWQTGEKINENNTEVCKEFIKQNGGDTSIEVLHENKNYLVILSIDSCIELIIAIKKDNFEESQTIEF